MGRHWSERLECNACGKVFRSMSAEAQHRHSFPVMCKRNKRFAAFEKEIADAQAAALPDPVLR